MSFKLWSFICVACFTVTEVEGFAKWCTNNQTLFPRTGSNATFVVDQPQSLRDYFRLIKTGTILSIDLHQIEKYGNFSSDFIFIRDSFNKNRTFVEGHVADGTIVNMSITMSDIRMTDNGTYYSLDIFFSRVRLCWIIFVMDIQKQTHGVIEENKPTQMFGHPLASHMIRPVVNATMVWLLNGLNFTETALFREQDGLIWIPNVKREMNLQNITYRAVKDNGETSDVNYTLEVMYGPSWPLKLKPEKAQYFLKKGQTMPDISCSNDCNPACTVTWGEHSGSSTLRLGEVSMDTTGEYTCMASRNGSSTIVKAKIVVHVSDTTFVTFAIPIMIGIQALTTIGLGICAFYFFMRNRPSSCKSFFKQEQTMQASSADVPNITTEDRRSRETELDEYEELHHEAISSTPESNYEHIQKAGKSKGVDLEVYENTRLSSSSTRDLTTQVS